MAAPVAFDRNDVVRIRGERWRVIARADFGETAVLHVDGCDAANRSVRARFLLPSERCERLPASGEPRVVRPRRWRRHVRLQLADAHPRIDSLRTAAAAGIRIMPFQLEPALAAVRGVATRLLVADEVGLGKTIQASLIVAEVLARTTDGRAIVVCPASLRSQWRDELRERFRLDAVVLDAASVAAAAWASPNTPNPWAAAPVIVTSIDFVKRPEVIRALESIVWDAVVLDEAHALSGVSERAHAAGAIAARSRLVVMLSATPHAGDEEAFARLQRLGRLPGDPPLMVFRRTRSDAGLPALRRTRWLRVASTREERELHRGLLAYARQVWRRPGASGDARLAVSVLIKRACSSATSAARSIEKRLSLLASPAPTADTQLTLPWDDVSSADAEPAAVLGAPGLSDPAEERRRLQELLGLALRASQHESKLGALQRLLRRAGEPAIVFTEYRDTLNHVARTLSAGPALLLHGGQTLRERQEALRTFTTGAGHILLATDAASEGLNLHHRCRLVIDVELPWTPLRLEQRVGRVDRIGQPRRVHAVHLVAGGTPEEETVSRLLRRSALASAALAAAAGGATEREMALLVVDGRIEAPEPPAAPRNETIVDVRAAACTEAERLVGARSLGAAAADTGDELRPPVSALRRRPRPPATTCCWAYRASFVDSTGHLLWSTLMALTATAPPRRGRQPLELRALLDPDRPSLQETAARTHHDALNALTAALQPWLAVAWQRERDIANDIERTLARLAVRQPGLFDRRAERAAHAQSAVLDAALSGCADRLGHLARLRSPAVGPCALAFAVAIE